MHANLKWSRIWFSQTVPYPLHEIAMPQKFDKLKYDSFVEPWNNPANTESKWDCRSNISGSEKRWFFKTKCRSQWPMARYLPKVVFPCSLLVWEAVYILLLSAQMKKRERFPLSCLLPLFSSISFQFRRQCRVCRSQWWLRAWQSQADWVRWGRWISSPAPSRGLWVDLRLCIAGCI